MLDVNMDGTMDDIAKHLTIVNFKQHGLSKKTINKWINKWINKSINQSIHRSIDRSIDGSINHIHQINQINHLFQQKKPTLPKTNQLWEPPSPFFPPFFGGFLYPTTNEKPNCLAPRNMTSVPNEAGAGGTIGCLENSWGWSRASLSFWKKDQWS